MSDNVTEVDAGSFVVYQSPNGQTYHRKPACAADCDIPPALDGANDLLDGMEMYRVKEIEATDENLCGNCTSKLRDILGI
jgi:hypothetical protein